jgi:DNA helicase-2/ATP-dependent DNA helicase PcrA
MINWVIKAFEENKNLLARYQEQFLYILVDEYQDTSGTQNRIVELLINYWDKPNVFVVGDDDQSIYRFQGANIENMMDFAGNYKNDLKTVVLTSNYRSTQPILDVSRSLIAQNEERLVKKIEGLSKDLISSNEAIKHLTDKPLIKEYETQRQEMIDITLQVQQLLAQGVLPKEIAVIYKENRYGEELADYFRLRNVPYYSKRNLNILELPLAQKIILILKYLAAEHDVPYGGDEMLFEILHFDWFHIPAIEIARLSVQASETKYTDRESSLRKLLNDKSLAPVKDLFSVNIHEGLKNASTLLERFISHVPNLTLQHLFENIIRESGILNHILQSPDKHFQLQVLTGLFDFIKEETRRNPSLTLKELVRLIELMEKEDIPLPLVQVSGNERGVNLLTAHGAKGLEFEHVFFAGCNSSFWEKKRKPGDGYKLPDTIFSSQPKHNDEEELRRLFYVAVTRAKLHLHISYSKFKNDGKELEPSVFIEEIKAAHDLPAEKIFITEEMLSEFSLLHFGEAAAPEIEKTEKEFVERILEKFVMNVTALNNYLKCPLEFYFKTLIRIPSPKNEATEFGSAVHYALEKLFRKMSSGSGEAGSGKEIFPSKKEFIADFEWYMHRHRESFNKEQFDRRMEYGQEVLNNYYDKYINSFNKIVVIERTIRNVTVKNVPIKGKLDKLEFDGKSVNVVDYKTGDPDKGILKMKGPSDKDPNGGDYWRQAVFYKILVDNYPQKDWKVVSTEFDFIEPDKKKNYQKKKIAITPDDIETVTQQIATVWEKIQNHEFYIGCGKPECHWCNFVKTNNLAVSLHELEEEENQDLPAGRQG